MGCAQLTFLFYFLLAGLRRARAILQAPSGLTGLARPGPVPPDRPTHGARNDSYVRSWQRVEGGAAEEEALCRMRVLLKNAQGRKLGKELRNLAGELIVCQIDLP